jgi:nitrogen-specific signal transduction histidine kinase
MNFDIWVQKDINPFIIFNEKGKIKYLNDEAEYFLSFVNEKEIFEFAINNLKDKFITINGYFKFNKFEFVSISIGYEENEIGIKFYKSILPVKKVKTEGLEKINLFFILEFCRNYVFLDKNIEFEDFFDVDVPQFFADKKSLIKALNSLFSKFKDEKKLNVVVKFVLGEKIKVNNKNYPVIGIKIKSVNKIEEILIPFITKK